MSCQLEVKSLREEAAVHEVLCFTITMRVKVAKVGGVRRRLRLCSPMFGYVRLWSDRSAIGKCNCRLRDAL